MNTTVEIRNVPVRKCSGYTNSYLVQMTGKMMIGSRYKTIVVKASNPIIPDCDEESVGCWYNIGF